MKVVERLIRVAPYRFCAVVEMPAGLNPPVSGDKVRWREETRPGRSVLRELTVSEVIERIDEGKRLFIRAEGFHPIDIVRLGA